VIAQRLVRKICPRCKEEYKPRKEELLFFGLDELEGVTFYRGRGCDHCLGTGYKGRTVIAEILIVSPQVAQLIAEGASGFEIARRTKFKSIKEDGIEKAMKGITTLEEVFRVID
jgi:type II secretory ATPase GspE/PulE/Tfp pilus assembly ATPase PilB-like protein